MTKYHYRLVATIYRHFRILLAEQNLTPCKMQLLSTVEKHDRFSDSAFLRRGKEVFHLGGIKAGDAPVFGVKFVKGGRVFIEPLADDEALFLFDQISIDESPISKGRFSAYAGFIRQGKFQRFTDNEKLWDGAEQLWTWISERIRNHHGIWKRNIGLYFKELEWKYNNRLLTPETQALKIAKIIPADFLVQWSLKAKKK
jgi:transposase-like protein